MVSDLSLASGRRPRARLVPIDPDFDVRKEGLSLRAAGTPLARRTLGDVGAAYRVTAKGLFPDSYLVIDFDLEQRPWIDASTIRVFYSPPNRNSYRPLWKSGANLDFRYVWARIDRPGTYVVLGLPRDRLLLETLRQIATTRRIDNVEGSDRARQVTIEPFERLFELGGDDLDELRHRITALELNLGADRVKELTTRRGQGFGIAAPMLPGDAEDFGDLREIITGLDPLPAGLPEEELFFPPLGPVPLPWPPEPVPIPRFYPELFVRAIPRIDLRWLFCLFWERTGRCTCTTLSTQARALCSSIRSYNVSTLRERHRVSVDGQVNSQPAIVAGHIYVGTMNASAALVGGVLYKINMATSAVEGTFSVDSGSSRQGRGIASTPAVVSGKVYFSALNGKLYCVDAATMAQDWVVDLRKQDLAHNQPVDHGADWATGWSSPVVVGERMYVGSGEGEHDTFGYVYCINAVNGNVEWLFCTDKFDDPNNPGNENQANVIPPSHWTGVGAIPAPFVVAQSDPAHPGSAPWSSAAYDAGLHRIYIGTGNAEPDNALPDPRYASGIISLDASTGEYKGFFQPAPGDSYRPTADFDVDVPGAPTIFSRSGQRLVGIGSKNGSYFLLEADGLALVERRQLLPYDSAATPFRASTLPTTTILGRTRVECLELLRSTPVGGRCLSASADTATPSTTRRPHSSGR